MTTEILFSSATIITGDEDAEPFVGDVLIAQGLIAEIGPPGSIESSSPTARRIDAKGFYLSPGFIDMHAHSDLYLLTNPDHEAKITQGCTVSSGYTQVKIVNTNILVQTEVVGQDGISYSPVRSIEELQSIRNQIAGWNGNPSDEECQTTHKHVGMFEWRTVGEYLDCLQRNRTATNVAMLVPQGNLRLLACGPYDTEATTEEIDDQVKLLREALNQGAVGMSR